MHNRLKASANTAESSSLGAQHSQTDGENGKESAKKSSQRGVYSVVLGFGQYCTVVDTSSNKRILIWQTAEDEANIDHRDGTANVPFAKRMVSANAQTIFGAPWRNDPSRSRVDPKDGKPAPGQSHSAASAWITQSTTAEAARLFLVCCVSSSLLCV